MSFLRSLSHCLSLALVLLVTNSALGLLENSSDDKTPFQLTYTPAHVVKDLTKSVTVRCDHDRRGDSQLGEISRIRMLKKSGGGWRLMAEMRDNEGTPKAADDVSVSARIDSNIRGSFLQITWALAVEETFGTYRCDVIGFDKRNFDNSAEQTSEVALLEEDVTTVDMMDMFKETKDELGEIEVHEEVLDSNVTSIRSLISVLTGEVTRQGQQVDSINRRLDDLSKSVEDNTNSLRNLG